MQTVTDHIRESILISLGLNKRIMPDLDSLKKSEWSPRFERLMRNRLIMGAFRYGSLNSPDKPVYDRLKGIIHHVEEYRKNGNLEHLVDVANIALCEFEEGRHPLRHFRAVDDGDHVAKIIITAIENSYEP